MRRQEKSSKKQQIISEYLNGDSTFKELGLRYGVPQRTIQTWVRSYRKQRGTGTDVAPVSCTSEVEKLKLKNTVLEEVLKIAHEETGIDFLKKAGAGRS